MVADIDVGLSTPEVISSIEFVSDECKLAEDPAPQPEKSITDRTKSLTKQVFQSEPSIVCCTIAAGFQRKL